VDLGDGDTPVEGDNGRRLQRFQQHVQVLNLLPIGLCRMPGPRVRRSDCCLQLKRARTLMPQSFVNEHQAFGDELAIPEATILILQQNDGLVGIQPRRCSRVLQQKQSRQSHHLAVVWKEA
jgi:hypothetical protein